MWKWMGLFLRKIRVLRCWGWPSILNWIWAFTLSLLLKLTKRKLEPWFVRCFFLLGLLCISINLPYGHAWNTVVMSGLVLLVATWNSWIVYKNRYRVSTKFSLENPMIPMTLPSIFDMISHDSKEFPTTRNLKYLLVWRNSQAHSYLQWKIINQTVENINCSKQILWIHIPLNTT